MIINDNYFELTDYTDSVTGLDNIITEFKLSGKKLEVLFISVPMSGRDIEDIQEEFKCMACKINLGLPEGTDLYVIPSLFKPDADGNFQPAHVCIAQAISLLSKATIVSIPHGHYNTRGCNFEQEYAMKYLLPTGKTCIIYQPKWDKETMNGQWFASTDLEVTKPKLGSMFGRTPFKPDAFFISHYSIEDTSIWEDM